MKISLVLTVLIFAAAAGLRGNDQQRLTATQWAMTLPPGPDRDATLKHIQNHPSAK